MSVEMEENLQKQEVTKKTDSTGIGFLLRKFLLKMKLIEQEERDLEREVVELDKIIKQKKIKNIINKF